MVRAHGRLASGQGVATDILEASARAYIRAMSNALEGAAVREAEGLTAEAASAPATPGPVGARGHRVRPMAGSLEGRKGLITGASSGIGEATAEAMVAEGAAVALGARRKDRLDELASRISDDGGTAVAIEADIGDEEQAKNLVETAHAELGGLDSLVNNAGVMLLGPLQGADPSEWRRMIDVNLLGLLYCTHYALPLIRDGGGGDVINVSSVAGRIAALGSGVYNMTKWGVVGYSESLRQEGALHRRPRHLRRAGLRRHRAQGHNKNPMVVERDREDAGADRRRCSRRRTSPTRSSTRSSQPKHVTINEILVRPTGQCAQLSTRQTSVITYSAVSAVATSDGSGWAQGQGPARGDGPLAARSRRAQRRSRRRCSRRSSAARPARR